MAYGRQYSRVPVAGLVTIMGALAIAAGVMATSSPMRQALRWATKRAKSAAQRKSHQAEVDLLTLLTVARSAGAAEREIMDLSLTNGGIPATTDERGGRFVFPLTGS